MNKYKGIVLVASLFILIVVSLIIAFGIGLVATQKAAVGLNIQGHRAFLAAHAGLERATETVNDNVSNCDSFPITVTMGGSLSGFEASVTCSRQTYDEDGTTITILSLRSTGDYTQNNRDYAQRVLERTVIVQ